MASVGVALSGGGHRATVWGLGALLYLVDAGKHREVTSVTSVSGGSIANGYVAHRVDLSTVDPEGFRDAVRPLLRLAAVEGLFFFGAATNAYAFAMLVAAAAMAFGALAWVVAVAAVLLELAGAFEAPDAGPLRLLAEPGWLLWHSLALAALTGLASWGFSLRSKVVDRALASALYNADGRPTLLGELDRRVDHVLCATELQSGDHLYLSPQFVYGYRFGVGGPGPMRLSTAVQASACLPGAFRARRLPTGPHDLRPLDGIPREIPRRMVLTDGGVYDNMADQWQQGFDRRARRWPGLDTDHHRADELVVVNASGGWTWRPINRWGLLRGELTTLSRVKSVMYDVTTSHRRQGLVGRFDRAELEGEGLRGALVHIPQSPWDVARRWARAGGPWSGRAARAADALTLLGSGPLDEQGWRDLARRSADVPTTLGALGTETAADLLYHAYVLAMCNLHTILGYPLLALPDREELAELVAP